MRTKRRKKVVRANWRASWKGELRFGLVRFSVEAVNAHSRLGGDIHFHQLHAKCHSRIKYQKTCPIHGEVDQDEIVLGYEYGRGKYIEIDPEELDAIRTDKERSLTIEEFIAPGDLDQIYFDGRMYYLAPVEAHDREPYHLFRRALAEEKRIGIGQVVFSGKEQLAAIAPRDQILIMAMLNYAPELRDPKALGVGEESPSTPSKNLRLAKDLIGSMTSGHFSIAAYEDHHRERVKELIDAKRKGKQVVAPPEEEEEPVINLMEALKKSLPRVRSHAKGNGKPAKRRRKAV
jgi:DNA end-binding protein Ku